MDITYIGLGKMGSNMVERLLEKGHRVHAYDASSDARDRVREKGIEVADSISALFQVGDTPRTVWLMVPHQVVGDVLEEMAPHLTQGDTVIEGGNSPYKKTIERARAHTERGINFLDAGVSGGPSGARNGACIMVGGARDVYDTYAPLFADLSVPEGYAYVGKSGAGHFVKMVHNGIEYGMMQAIAEGFDILKQSDLEVPLTDVARLYNHGSVIESRLIGWLLSGFEMYGEDLKDITGSAGASGEGLWTVETAKEMGIEVPVIEDALNVRYKSQKHPSYQGQLISVMRNQFGGHDAKRNNG